MEVGWAEKHSRFTALFERLSIDVLLGCQNQSKAKELLKLSWDEVHLIQEKAVQRGLERRVAGELKHLGVDEKSFLKGHQYATILSDLDRPRVLDVARDRKEDSLGELLNKISQPQRDTIEAVALTCGSLSSMPLSNIYHKPTSCMTNFTLRSISVRR